MQKFTRALVREIELAGQRLKITLDEQGISVGLIGSRRPPRAISWAALVAQLGAGDAMEPDAPTLTTALDAFKAVPSVRKPGRAAEPARAPSAPDLLPLLARLEDWLRSHRPRFAAALKPGASEDDLSALSAHLGTPLPIELRQLLSWHNGVGEDFSGAFQENWNLMSAAQIAEAKRELDTQAREGHGGWQPTWIPFLEDDEGDYLCLDPSRAGTPVREYRPGRSELTITAPSLVEWLSDLVSAVEAGQYYEDPERGQFLKQRR
jgi:cell wall assembly regulator SMI1